MAINIKQNATAAIIKRDNKCTFIFLTPYEKPMAKASMLNEKAIIIMAAIIISPAFLYRIFN